MAEYVQEHRKGLSLVLTLVSVVLLILGAVAAHRANVQYQRTRLAEEAMRSLVETSATAIITLDGEGKVTDWPGPATRMFGWTASEMVGQSIERLMPEEFRAAHRRGFLAFMDGVNAKEERDKWKETLRIRCTAVTKSGKNKEVIVTTRVTPDTVTGLPLAVATIDRASLVREVE